MRRRLLLSLIVVITASLGAECDNSSGSAAGGPDATSLEIAEQQDRLGDPGPTMPEPSAALVFAIALITARAGARRRR